MNTFRAALGSSSLPFSTSWLFFDCGANRDRETDLSYPASHAHYNMADYFWENTVSFTIPKSWMEEQLDEARTDSYVDRILLKSLRATFRDVEGLRVLRAVADDDLDRHPAYPAPMVYLNDLPFHHPHSLKRCLARLLSHHYAGSYERDLSDVMQATLPGFFHIPGCQVLRNPLGPPHHAAIAVPRSHVSIECRLPIVGVPACMWLPLLVAIPWDGRPHSEGAAELAKHFEWSLAFIVHLHSLVHPSKPLPHICSLLGVLYTPRGIVVYAHYARKSERDDEWHYVSVLLSTLFADNFMHRPDTEDMTDVVAALLLLQRHTFEVYSQIREWLDTRTGHLGDEKTWEHYVRM